MYSRSINIGGPRSGFDAWKDKVKNDEVNPDEPNLSVLQFYLREVEGIFTDQPDYETGEQKYHAVVEIGEQVWLTERTFYKRTFSGSWSWLW